MNTLWTVLGRLVSLPDTQVVFFDNALAAKVVAPKTVANPDLQEMFDFHEFLSDQYHFVTRGELWELFWILSRTDAAGKTLLEHLKAVRNYAKDASAELFPVLGLACIDHRFRKAAHQLATSGTPAESDAGLLAFLNRQTYENVDGVRIWSPCFGITDAPANPQDPTQYTVTDFFREVIKKQEVFASLESIESLGWVQPSAKPALKAWLGAYSCASGYSIPEAEALASPQEDWYAPHVMSQEQLAAWVMQEAFESLPEDSRHLLTREDFLEYLQTFHDGAGAELFQQFDGLRQRASEMLESFQGNEGLQRIFDAALAEGEG